MTCPAAEREEPVTLQRTLSPEARAHLRHVTVGRRMVRAARIPCHSPVNLQMRTFVSGPLDTSFNA